MKSVFEPECSSSRLPKSKKAEFTGVNEPFFDEGNEEIGHYGQTQNRFGFIQGRVSDGKAFRH